MKAIPGFVRLMENVVFRQPGCGICKEAGNRVSAFVVEKVQEGKPEFFRLSLAFVVEYFPPVAQMRRFHKSRSA